MRPYVLTSIVALALVAQSCCCCTMIGGPEPPYAITPSGDAVQRFKERWSTVVDGSLDGSFDITMTEEEMTSLIAQSLEKQEDAPPVSDLQVHFRNGRIEVYATVTVNESIPLPGLVAFSAAATDGSISVTLEEIAFGPLPIPDSVLEASTDMLNELISSSMTTEMGEVAITDIQVGEGEMTLTGTIASDSP